METLAPILLVTLCAAILIWVLAGGLKEKHILDVPPPAAPPAPDPTMSTLATFHIWQNEKSSGPFTVRELQDKLKAGAIDNATLIARSGDADWLPIFTFADVINIKPPAPKVSAPPAVVESAASMAASENDALAKLLSLFLVFVGLLVMCSFAFGYDTTVGTRAGDIHNVGRISHRETAMIFGAAVFVGGCVLWPRRR